MLIFSKKNLKKLLDLTGRISLLKTQKESKELAVSAAAELLGVNRTSVYYKPANPSELEIKIKHEIDKIHTDSPTRGSRQLSKTLKNKGYAIGRLKTRRYMEEMNIKVIYPKPNLSKPAKENKIYPYLLRNAVILRTNQAWSIDITYIRLRHGFVYLTAIIDWYSRYIVGWELDDTISTKIVKQAVGKALKISKPVILNSDQDSQFTSIDYIQYIESQKIKISMDGKSRWADNILLEQRFHVNTGFVH